MMDIVSVIIPTHGGGEYLIRAVESVFNQDYKNIEVIIVDDNGKGTESQLITQRRLGSYLEDARLQYIVHDQNSNGAVARNTGVKYSKGKYIAFLDDDDTYRVNKISSQVQHLLQFDESWGMSYCSHETYLNGKYIETVHVKKSGDLLYDILRHKVTVGSSSLLIKKDIFNSIGGFDESFWRHQDWEFTARVASTCQIVATPIIGFERHLTFRNSPRSIEKAQQNMDHYLSKMNLLIKKLPKRQQKEIIVSNQLGIVMRYLRSGEVGLFFKRFNEINAGLTGVLYVFKLSSKYLYKKYCSFIRNRRLNARGNQV